MAKSKNLQLKGEGGKGASKCFNVTAPNDVSICCQRSESGSDVPVPLFELEQLQAQKDEEGEGAGVVGPKSSFRLNSLYKDPPFPAGDVLDEAVVTGLSPLPSPNPGGRFSPRIGRYFSLQTVKEEEIDNETREAIGAALDATRHSIFDSLCNDDNSDNSDANNNEDLNRVNDLVDQYNICDRCLIRVIFCRISFCSPKTSRAAGERQTARSTCLSREPYHPSQYSRLTMIARTATRTAAAIKIRDLFTEATPPTRERLSRTSKAMTSRTPPRLMSSPLAIRMILTHPWKITLFLWRVALQPEVARQVSQR